MIRLPESLPLRRALIAAVLLALVAIQALGAVHRVIHAPGTEHHESHGLFAGHSSATDCDLFDDLAAGGFVPSVAALDLVDATVEVPLPPHAGWHLAAQAAGFLARGPPAAS